jgi:hypothetical protein
VPSSLHSAVVQSPELGSNLECSYGQRFQVNSKSGPKLVVTPLKWPLTNKTVPTPSVELLLCCHTCYQGTLISQAPAAPYPVVDPVVQSPSPREQQLAAQLRIEQARADAYEVDALQAQLYRERIRKNDPDYKGVPEDYPRRKTEVIRRQSDQAKHWKAKYKVIKPSDKELNRLLSTYGPMKEVRASLAEARRINSASGVSTREEVPLLRQQVTDLRAQIAKNEENSMDATEVARLIEQAEAQITTKTEEMISDCLSKLESAERSNEISEEKRDALQEKYDEVRCCLCSLVVCVVG